ncbi:TonB-linked outer membrane protein, SusC/RagA family [Mucilaginibacter pineti]|uniref:TonB-linked outer membrane protein, SusC/RagA family n=1 Tax=Mucilaginibacter pineti TaxID=1391627 RepID=A0A1G6WXI7_9SPHI|nr:SusC/RagA family TonB-linked outer membrane protein [Mucilaginibacter pineti]SDD70373.1 TonB-linked outer membrane protein, SusC/RagA family [Mucilaginibacter pineti]
MIRISTVIIYMALLLPFGITKAHAGAYKAATFNYSICFQQDTADTVKKKLDTVIVTPINRALLKGFADSLNVKLSTLTPNASIQQMLKGNIAGVYVQETTGEPGTEQSMIIRGLSSPLFSKNDIYNQQPMVYVNGVPLVQESSFVFDIQKYGFNRIGPATNLLAGYDIGNINSIEVIKDPLELAKLGPNAANGAVWITTKGARSGNRQLSINSYFGFVQASKVSTTNAAYENQFRKPFYQKYATESDYLNYPGYLRDSTNADYYGPARWNDLYYQNTAVHSVDLGLTGGSDRANFRFFGSGTTNAGNADNTALNRYTASFQINMLPFSWLTVSSNVNASRMDRDRNRSLRDRFAETRYIPDLYNPLPPSENTYQALLNEDSKSIDNNKTTAVNGYLSLGVDFNKFKFVSRLSFDYNQGTRDVFYPSTLMEGNNYVSSYLGYNQRFRIDNSLNYTRELNKDNKVVFTAGQSYQTDTHKYNYANAYNGPNDFIKINVVEGGTDSATYLKPVGYLVYRYIDKEQARLFSVYGSAKYEYKDLLSFSALIRDDGSSNAQPGSRWFIAPAFSGQWNLKNQFLKESSTFDDLTLNASWSRIGKPFTDDRFAAGPQYRVEIGWDAEPTIPGYNGVAGISRPYTSGWVGYNLKWSYTDELNVALNASLFKGRLNASATYYIKDDKRMLLSIPVPQEYGFESSYVSGMGVRNTGIELGLQGSIIKTSNGLNWTSGINASINKNKLTALPNGLDELVIGDRKLKVGQAIDQFYIFQNQGIYNSDSEVPVNPATNKRMTFEGTTLKAGDPKWQDLNGDYVINDADKVLKGHSMPKITGGWSNDFRYGNFDLNFNIIFAVGQKALNQVASSQYDFINRESGNDINSIKEIFSWQVNVDASKYPIYNPWSSVVPYRLDQDLFLENASYAKLRTVSVGYDLSKSAMFTKLKSTFKRAYIYLTANNLVTVSPFSGSDPELIDYNGIYTGYGMAIPRTYIIGLKLDL